MYNGGELARALRGKIEEESSKKLNVHVMEGCGGRRVSYIFICLFLRCIVMTSIISIIFFQSAA